MKLGWPRPAVGWSTRRGAQGQHRAGARRSRFPMPVPRNRHLARFAPIEVDLLSVELLEYGASLPARPTLGVARRRRLLEVATALGSLSLLTLPIWGSLLFPT